MKEEDVGVGGKGNAEPGFDLFALDQPARVPHGKGRGGEGKVSRGFVTPESELSIETRRETPPRRAGARLPAASNC